MAFCTALKRLHSLEAISSVGGALVSSEPFERPKASSSGSRSRRRPDSPARPPHLGGRTPRRVAWPSISSGSGAPARRRGQRRVERTRQIGIGAASRAS